MRLLSSFHFWLPIYLIWVVSLVGFAKRAILLWTGLTWVLLAVCGCVRRFGQFLPAR
jgi:hypothetical protein